MGAQTESGVIFRTISRVPKVRIIRKMMDGTRTVLWLPANEAVQALWLHPDNGVTVRSAHIDWGRELDCWSYSA